MRFNLKISLYKKFFLLFCFILSEFSLIFSMNIEDILKDINWPKAVGYLVNKNNELLDLVFSNISNIDKETQEDLYQYYKKGLIKEIGHSNLTRNEFILDMKNESSKIRNLFSLNKEDIIKHILGMYVDRCKKKQQQIDLQDLVNYFQNLISFAIHEDEREQVKNLFKLKIDLFDFFENLTGIKDCLDMIKKNNNNVNKNDLFKYLDKSFLKNDLKLREVNKDDLKEYLRNFNKNIEVKDGFLMGDFRGIKELISEEIHNQTINKDKSFEHDQQTIKNLEKIVKELSHKINELEKNIENIKQNQNDKKYSSDDLTNIDFLKDSFAKQFKKNEEDKAEIRKELTAMRWILGIVGSLFILRSLYIFLYSAENN